MRFPRGAALGLIIGALAGYSAVLTWNTFGSGAHRARADEAPENPAYASAEEVQEDFRAVSAEVLPAIVEITVKTETLAEDEGDRELPWNDFFADPSEESEEGPRYFRSHGLGSGVIVERDGDVHYAVTNAHVVGDGGEIDILLHDGSTAVARLMGTDERKDLAVLEFTVEDSGIRPVRIGDSDRLYVGDWVLAYGSPYGYEQSVSSGIVSALGRRDGPGDNINDFIQTDAAINQGNSGGALVNVRGELVGINTFITTPNSGSIGLGFAIPVNNVMRSVRQLIDDGEVRYGWLGVSLGAYGPEAAESLGYDEGAGALVYQVFEGSPAEKAGLRPGDLIRSLDGRPFSDTEMLIYRIGDKAPGSTALFGVDRFGAPEEIAALMGERDEEDAVREMHGAARPGFVAAPLTEDIRGAMALPDDLSGVPVAEVYPRTAAQAVDLRAGDIIVAVGGTPTGGLRELYEALSLVDPEDPDYRVYRDGAYIELNLHGGGLP